MSPCVTLSPFFCRNFLFSLSFSLLYIHIHVRFPFPSLPPFQPSLSYVVMATRSDDHSSTVSTR